MNELKILLGDQFYSILLGSEPPFELPMCLHDLSEALFDTRLSSESILAQNTSFSFQNPLCDDNWLDYFFHRSAEIVPFYFSSLNYSPHNARWMIFLLVLYLLRKHEHFSIAKRKHWHFIASYGCMVSWFRSINHGFIELKTENHFC